MGKQKLILGITLGAVLGGVVSLFDKETRRFVSAKLDESKNEFSQIIEHPTESLTLLKHDVLNAANKVTDTLDSALNAMDQVESTIETLRKDEPKKIN